MTPEVKVGQVWKDCDYRSHGRRIRIVAIEGDRAVMAVLKGDEETGRRVKIRINRLKPCSTGYRLVEDAP